MNITRFISIPAMSLAVAALACSGDATSPAAPSAPVAAQVTGTQGPAGVATATTTQRDIMDWVNAQTGEFFWTAPAQSTGARANNLFMFIDYAGRTNAQIVAAGGTSLGTTFSGSITERGLPDGTAEVHVRLHTDNAFADGGDLITGVLYFGHTAGQVFGGAQPGLGSCDLDLTFINTAPGAPLPNLGAIPASAFKTLFFRGSATGPLRAAFGVPDGTPGRGHVVQNGLYQASGQGATADIFPAERVDFNQVGN